MKTPAVCLTCAASFQPKRRGQKRERRCPMCIREWRWSGHRLHRLPSGVRRPAGGLWPELVAAELERQGR